jgi:hypothetical protein
MKEATSMFTYDCCFATLDELARTALAIGRDDTAAFNTPDLDPRVEDNGNTYIITHKSHTRLHDMHDTREEATAAAKAWVAAQIAAIDTEPGLGIGENVEKDYGKAIAEAVRDEIAAAEAAWKASLVNPRAVDVSGAVTAVWKAAWEAAGKPWGPRGEIRRKP